ncbi:hypothetical protein [Pelomonas aquatica]|jgi:hypothetical protein|uniref:DUF4124 domain-containing protein n=1 Tax=Pelomonas aquatica TaxID=431058 RepID=A0A9X4LHR8_9BURK|nr:hypothetical protein [Pelomonas aquatica]MCY4753602.1 hypothetical protein [Pelomonas aquatica]MDG0863254.1 hypothetical protein [Pelomonas aquatica]
MKPLLLALAAVIALPALAQSQVRQAQVYRCGPDGRDLRDSPCPGSPATSGGSIRYDEPSAADSRAARERHLADARQAAALAAARRASEAEARHQRALSLGLQPPPAAASAPQVVHIKPPKVAKPARPHRPEAAASAAR